MKTVALVRFTKDEVDNAIRTFVKLNPLSSEVLVVCEETKEKNYDVVFHLTTQQIRNLLADAARLTVSAKVGSVVVRLLDDGSAEVEFPWEKV